MAKGKLEARITIPTGGWSCSITDDSVTTVAATVAAGTYYMSSAGSGSSDLVEALQTAINAVSGDTWTVSISAGESGTGKVTIDTDGASFSVAWTSSQLRDLLGFDADISAASTAQTGSAQAQALWLPSYGWTARHGNSAFLGHPISDKHDYVNAAGYAGGIAGQTRYVHSLAWPMESNAKTNKDSEVTANESFQTFLEDGLHAGKEWASVGGPIRFYGDADTDTTYTTWYVPGLQEYGPSRIETDWDGLWRVEIPLLVRVPGTAAGAGGEEAEAAPTSVAELYAHSDPAQAIIELMSYATKPDYLWLGNVADGAWVDTESSLSMAKASTPLFEQAESAFGGASSVEFDGTSDGFTDSTNNGSLDIGTGDYQMLIIFKSNTAATGLLYSKYGTKGYRHYTLSTGYHYHNIAGASGTATASIAVDHGTTNPQVMLCTKTSSATAIATREGTASSATAVGNADADASTAFKFGVGGTSAHLSNIAMFALWIGTGDLTDTERTALGEGLGLE